MHELKLRKTTANDSEFAYRVKKAAFRVYVEQVWGWDEDEQRAQHKQRFASQDFQIISVHGSDVGILALVRQPDYININQVYILPEHQGRGIGAACMMHVIEEAAALNLPIRLRVLKVNPRAILFYHRLGFVNSGETDTHVLMEKTP
jgi:GNAT superfamily N-acetyltransferase